MTGPVKLLKERVYADENGDLLLISYNKNTAKRLAIIQSGDATVSLLLLEPKTGLDGTLKLLGLTDLGEL